MDAEESPEGNSSDNEEFQEEPTRNKSDSSDESDSSDDCIIVDDIKKGNTPRLILRPTADLWESKALVDPEAYKVKKETLESEKEKEKKQTVKEKEEEEVSSASHSKESQENENERSISPPILPAMLATSSCSEDDMDEEGSDFFDSCFEDEEMDEVDSNSDSSSEEEEMDEADTNIYSSPEENNTVEPMDEEVPEKSPSEDNNSSEKFVWVKWTGKNYWPAIIIQPSDCGRQSVKDNHAWVFWFGSHDISQVAMKKMASFIANFNIFFKRPGKLQLRAIEETIGILAKMSSKTINNSEDLVPWAKAGFPGINLQNDSCLKPLLKKYLKQDEKETDEIEAEDEPSVNLFNEFQAGNLKIEDICVACYKKDMIMNNHPFFHAYICAGCKKTLSSTILAIGGDAKNLCCIMCGKPGNLVVCEQPNCSKSYCTKCLKSIAGIVRTAEIMKISPWACIFCLEDNIPFKRRINWEQELLQFLGHPNYYPKRPITVLSLFDGISTGKVVLEKLQISIKKYYACEIDPDALTVSEFNHPGIHYLGDIRDITRRTFRDIEELDLVLAGPPCKDFSLANTKRKKLTAVLSTNSLFIHLIRVLNIIKAKYGHVFVLIENVPMILENKDDITAFLKPESTEDKPEFTEDKIKPILVDAVYFSPQTRSRYFWGNIPGLKCLSEYWNAIPSEAMEKYDLDDYVDRIRDRRARGTTLRTVTCQGHSIKLTDGSMPIMMEGEESKLSVTELELVFGLPHHYTDAGTISLTRRRQLLGQAWSAQVLFAMLHPLKYFFKC